MSNLILERTNQVPYFTNMRKVFEALNLDPSEFDWFLSDIETNYFPPGFNDSDQWLAGDKLRDLIQENEIQFIWGVFSAVPKGTRLEVTQPPFVERKFGYWYGADVRPQLTGALFEIVSWDSSATILIGIPDESATHFISVYSHAHPLGVKHPPMSTQR
jgi:elongation factor P hydroxylase